LLSAPRPDPYVRNSRIRLRGTGILARAEQGYETDQIANDIGMSRQNVDHYMRFRDQVKTADAGQRRLKLVSKED
jgi:predicted transcriptional regulator